MALPPPMHPGGGMHYGGSGTWEHHQLHPRGEMRARGAEATRKPPGGKPVASFAYLETLDPAPADPKPKLQTINWKPDHKQLLRLARVRQEALSAAPDAKVDPRS